MITHEKHGLTGKRYDEVFNDLLEKQQGVCNICGKNPHPSFSFGGLCIDHDHDTGKIRGLLCRSCNTFMREYDNYIRQNRPVQNLTFMWFIFHKDAVIAHAKRG